MSPPVGDVAPAGRGQRPAELLHGERRAERAELEALGQRPVGEGAQHHGGGEHVAGAGGVGRGDGHRRAVRLLAGGAVDRVGAGGAIGHHRERYHLREFAHRPVGAVGAGVAHGLEGIGRECVAVSERSEVGEVPAPRLVEADVGEDLRAAPGQVSPPGGLPREIHDRGARGRGLRDECGERLGEVVPVGGHRPVPLGGDGDRQGGVEIGEATGGAEVDALLMRHGVPHPVGVGVVPEPGDQPGAQAQTGGRDGEVGDPAGTGSHALAPQLLAGLR